MKWNAIDLHMHTKSGFTRDKTTDQVKFAYIKYVDVLKKYDLKLCAVTNHNVIDFCNYVSMNYLANKLNRNILLGVELDTVMENDKPLHTVAIFEKNFIQNFAVSQYVSDNTNKKIANDQKIIYSADEIVKIVKDYNAILIPHGIKAKGIFEDATSENILEALQKVKEGFVKVFDSPSNWKLEQIKDFLLSINYDFLDDFGGVLFSDVRDWDSYEKNFRNFYMNAEPTFKGLIHSITNPTRRFKKKDDIEINDNYIHKIVIKEKDNRNRILLKTIELSNDYNCIIGKSGTGKSLLMHLIRNKLCKNKPESEVYGFSNYTDIDVYNEKGVLLNQDTINVGLGAQLYDKIISAYSSRNNEDIYKVIELINDNFNKRQKFNAYFAVYKQKIVNYYNLRNVILNNKNDISQKIAIISSKISQQNQLNSIETFNINTKTEDSFTYSAEYLRGFINYKDEINLLKELLIQSKESEAEIIKNIIDKLEIQFFKLDKKMNYRFARESLKKRKIAIINGIIGKINGSISSKAQQKTKLSVEIPKEIIELTTLIKQTYINEAKLLETDLSMNAVDINDERLVNKKHNIVIKETINVDLTKINPKDNDIFNTYGKKGQIFDAQINLTNKLDATKLINHYIDIGLISESKTSLNDELDVEVKIMFDGQSVNELNPGTIAKTYISIYFEDEIKSGKYHVILFDQIENDVDKSFISETLCGLIQNTKGYVQLLIVTHDPIVAVNADPTRYIESTVLNSMFDYRDFSPESEFKDELKTIAENVDGSKKVIKDRYEIYGGDRIE